MTVANRFDEHLSSLSNISLVEMMTFVIIAFRNQSDKTVLDMIGAFVP
jgi:hypothetical protein